MNVVFPIVSCAVLGLADAEIEDDGETEAEGLWLLETDALMLRL